MEKLHRPKEKHEKIIDGIISYIAEYIKEEANSGLVSYKQTLNLIEKLGTPTEKIGSIRSKIGNDYQNLVSLEETKLSANGVISITMIMVGFVKIVGGKFSSKTRVVEVLNNLH